MFHVYKGLTRLIRGQSNVGDRRELVISNNGIKHALLLVKRAKRALQS